MTVCVLVAEACQSEFAQKPYGFRWTEQFANRWEADFPYALGSRIRPSIRQKRSGLEFEATTGGQSSGRSEPKWPTTLGESITDGSVTWQAVALSYDGLAERIDTVDWAVSPSGLTIAPRAYDDLPGLQQTLVDVSDGTVGETYDVTCTVTTTVPNVYYAILRMSIE
jgi:hypothetical protein